MSSDDQYVLIPAVVFIQAGDSETLRVFVTQRQRVCECSCVSVQGLTC